MRVRSLHVTRQRAAVWRVALNQGGQHCQHAVRAEYGVSFHDDVADLEDEHAELDGPLGPLGWNNHAMEGVAFLSDRAFEHFGCVRKAQETGLLAKIGREELGRPRGAERVLSGYLERVDREVDDAVLFFWFRQRAAGQEKRSAEERSAEAMSDRHLSHLHQPVTQPTP